MDIKALRAAAMVLILGLAGVGAAVVPAPAAAATCARPGNLSAIEASFAQAMNADRRKAGLSGVTLSPELTRAAQDHACDMAKNNYFAHRDARGASAMDRVRGAGFKSCLTAENIAKGQASVAVVLTGWMASSGHRANILRRDVTRIGVGAARPGSGAGADLHWVLVMARPC